MPVFTKTRSLETRHNQTHKFSTVISSISAQAIRHDALLINSTVYFAYAYLILFSKFSIQNFINSFIELNPG